MKSILRRMKHRVLPFHQKIKSVRWALIADGNRRFASNHADVYRRDEETTTHQDVKGWQRVPSGFPEEHIQYSEPEGILRTNQSESQGPQLLSRVYQLWVEWEYSTRPSGSLFRTSRCNRHKQVLPGRDLCLHRRRTP